MRRERERQHGLFTHGRFEEESQSLISWRRDSSVQEALRNWHLKTWEKAIVNMNMGSTYSMEAE
ncbi:hypothetical protein CKAN_00388000 [Cinnamomum micranthum f. kanehirae]|uniref:Uncharacterized protein n=1 Tax=Cinnamomum micranthum f. kanehirae TaxID=337451 RepID=A0A443NAF5_9MAGN|nr:hypothetical protein CKAN_00388000 [Cinnamomum micranthum f. kanehirae]